MIATVKLAKEAQIATDRLDRTLNHHRNYLSKWKIERLGETNQVTSKNKRKKNDKEAKQQ